VQFWNSLAKVPAGAQLVMLFGEIDCREGMLVRVCVPTTPGFPAQLPPQ
jgi:hypothetical protein